MSKTQNQRIIDLLLVKKCHSLTSAEASEMRDENDEKDPVMRLSERIRELEARGVIFLRTDQKKKKGRGKYTRYHLLSLENYHPRGETPDTRLDTVQEQYAGVDDPWADAKHDAQIARL